MKDLITLDDSKISELSLPPGMTVTDRLKDYVDLQKRQLKPNTFQSFKDGWAAYERYCRTFQLPMIPADEFTLRGFIRHRKEVEGVKGATVARSLTAIKKMHGVLGLPNPIDNLFVTGELTAAKASDAHPEQVTPLRYEHLKLWYHLNKNDEDLKVLRQRAMLWMGYDGLLRSAELAKVHVNHIERNPSGEGTLFLPDSKTDKSGDGFYLYMRPRTMTYVKDWRDASGINEGPLFVKLYKGGKIGTEPLNRRSVFQILNKTGGSIDLAGTGGHSLRVGALLDMIDADAKLAGIMKDGRWKTERMPVYYARKRAAVDGEMAKLSQSQDQP